MMKLSLLIQATERVTGPVRRIQRSIRGMVVTGERDVKRLDRVMERLNKTAGRVGSAIGRTLRRGAVAGAVAAGGLITSIVSISSKFEQFQVVLENTEGSAAAARQAMSWVKKFAATTPYELDQVMESYVRLRAYGIDPTNGSLRSLGDAASGMGKDIMSAVEMLADAQMGEFERLKEFGVRASVEGGKVRFTYMKAGKEVTKTAQKSAAAIQEALTGIFDDRFKGMMDRQSRTLGGLWSNLKDQAANFQLDIGNAGFFDFLKGKLQELLAWVQQLAADGRLQKWAKDASDWLVRMGKRLATIDWAQVGRGALDVANALAAVARGVLWVVQHAGGLVDFFAGLVILKVAVWLGGVAGALGLVSVAGLPLWGIVAIVAAIAFGAYKLMRNWSTVAAYFAKVWSNIRDSFRTGAAMVWNALPVWMRGALSGGKIALNFVGNLFNGGAKPGAQAATANGGRLTPQGAPLRQGRPAIAGRKTAEVGGRLDIRLTTDRGARATVTRLDSANNNVPIDVTRGRVGLG